VDSGEFPKLAGDFEGVDAGLLPPSFLVTSPMNCAMVGAAERNSEFVAGLAAKRPRLHKSDLMGVRGLAAAQQARLLRHKAEMLIVPVAARSAQREHALVCRPGLCFDGVACSRKPAPTSAEAVGGGLMPSDQNPVADISDPIRHAQLEMPDHRGLSSRDQIASGSLSAVLNSTI
jgi:hypothetical protein